MRNSSPPTWIGYWLPTKANLWAQGRLPTEAEWEYAARGGQAGWKYEWGNGLEEPTTKEWSAGKIGPVGSHSPNGFGLRDFMSGPTEWCLDRVYTYGKLPSSDPVGRSAIFPRPHVARGRPPEDDEISKWRISRRFDGLGLPEDFGQHAGGFRYVLEGTNEGFTRIDSQAASALLANPFGGNKGGEIDQMIAEGDEQMEAGYGLEALKQYQKAIEVDTSYSLAHFRLGEVYFTLNNYNAAVNEFRRALDGDLQPLCVEAWSHVLLGESFDMTGLRERALNEYKRAVQLSDNSHGAVDTASQYIRQPYNRTGAREFER